MFPRKIKRLRNILLLALIPITTCKTPPVYKEQARVDGMRIGTDGDYQYLEFADGVIYRASVSLCEMYSKRAHLLSYECREQLTKPEILEEVLDEIDGDDDRAITFWEALAVCASKEKFERLQEILTPPEKSQSSSAAR